MIDESISGERREDGIYADEDEAYSIYDELTPDTYSVRDGDRYVVHITGYEIEPVECIVLDDGYVLSYHSIDVPDWKITADIREG